MHRLFTNPRIAVIGAGISGLCCARALARRDLDVVVFEKARGPGGRMSTRRDPEKKRAFDHGTQYFTAKTPGFGKQVERWVGAGVVAPWTGRIGTLSDGAFRPDVQPHPRYVGVPRMSALTRYLAHNLYLRSGTRIASMKTANPGWILESTSGTTFGPFTAVISAIPAPQALPLLAHSPVLAPRIASVKMQPCFASMVAFNYPLPVGFDAARIDDGPLTWIARNTSKPSRSEAECWVLHTRHDWSKEHLHRSKSVTHRHMLDAFEALTESPAPAWAMLHLWRYARPEGPFDSQTPCLWDPTLGLGACGDWLIGGRVESAWWSSQAMVMTVLKWLRAAARG